MSASSYQNHTDWRVVVVGTSGAGKSRLARQLASLVGAPHIELDALHWGPGWTPRAPDAFAAAVRAATAGERWVIDGNYRAVRDIFWPRATHIVWLDHGRATIMARVWRRTLWRASSVSHCGQATANRCASRSSRATASCCGRGTPLPETASAMAPCRRAAPTRRRNGFG